MKYSIYQIVIDSALHAAVNKLGHDGAAAAFPKYAAHLATSFRGSRNFKPEFGLEYSRVATIEAANLEDVFEFGNGHGDPAKLAGAVTRLAQFHSVSVGDIVVDPVGQCFMCDSIGWTLLDFDKISACSHLRTGRALAA